MKTAAALFILTTSVALAVEAIPSKFARERYEELSEDSPFALATPVAAPPEPPKDDIYKNWAVTGMARTTEGGVTRDHVYILKREDGTRLTLVSGQTPSDDADPGDKVVLSSVDWQEPINKSRVIIKGSDGQMHNIEFSQDAAAAAPPPQTLGRGNSSQGGNGQPPRSNLAQPPGTPIPGSGAIKPPTNNSIITTPNAPSSIPRPGNVPLPRAQPLPGTPPGVPAPGGQPTNNGGRSRIRVINSK